jgi:hypothetical protein
MVLPPSMQGSLPAGWLAFTGRELNPLDRSEGFQITSSSSLPGFSWRNVRKPAQEQTIRPWSRSTTSAAQRIGLQSEHLTAGML